ncbi:MAG: tripartite tricarboxylate transporter substrate binding protein [Burkholderiales bacterium]
MNRLSAWVLAACSLPALAGEPPASDGRAFPTKPLRFVVPFPPGGSDTVARLLAQKLVPPLGQQVIVDNRPGAGGTVGTDIAAKAAPDGYTLLFATASFAISAKLYKKLPFDPVRDFTAIAPICSGPMLLVVHPSVSARTSAELVKLAKERPGVLNFASTGTGSITHLAAEIFKSATGISITHVPYKGTGPALSDLVAGQVQLTFVPLGAGLPYVRASRLRALGVASAKRSSASPEIATISESGVPGYEAATWYGVLVPAGTPGAIVARLNKETVAALAQPDTVKQLASLGFDPTPATSHEFQRFIASELAKWGKVIGALGIAAD